MTTTMERAAIVPPALDLDTLFREHRTRLCRYIALTGTTSRADAEDIVQDAFAWAWQYRDRRWMVPRKGAMALLYAVTRQAAIRRWRQTKPAILAGDWADEWTDQGASGESGYQRTVDRDRMRALANQLPGLAPRRRRVLHLRYWEGLPWSQVAEHMGITVGAAKTLEDFALAQLRQRIADPDRGPGAQARRRAAVRDAIRRDPGLLDKLPSRQREAIRLRYIDGLTYPQAAERMGVNERTVAFHFDRARARILAEAVSA